MKRPGAGSFSVPASPRRGRQVIRQMSIIAALGSASLGLAVPELLDVVGGDASPRTLYRDLEQLQEVGFALASDRGRWSLTDTARARIPATVEELLAVVLAREVLEPLAASSLVAPLDSLCNKLLAVLTPQGRRYVQELAQTRVASFTAPGRLDGHADVIAKVEEALAKEQILRLRYAAPGRAPEDRDVEPRATWYANGRLYLIAWCRKASAPRTFAIARVEHAELLDEVFEPDPEFDPQAYAARAFGVHQGPVEQVVVEFDREVAHLPEERLFHPTQHAEPLPGGRVRLSFQAAGLPEIAAWVTSFGGAIRAVAPPALVAAVRQRCEGALRAHSGDIPRNDCPQMSQVGSMIEAETKDGR